MEAPIDVAPIESTNLAGIGYSTERETLAVEFKPRKGHMRGPIFHYKGVDVGVFDELLGAESKGSFYAKNIKGKFTAERVTGPCSECQEEGPIGTRCVCGGTHRQLETRYKDQE